MNKTYINFPLVPPTTDRLYLHADPTTGELAAAEINSLVGLSSYAALISQSGTDAPTAIELSNNIGPVSFEYYSGGTYLIICAGAFIPNTFIAYLDPIFLINQAFNVGSTVNIERFTDNSTAIIDMGNGLDDQLSSVGLIILRSSTE